MLGRTFLCSDSEHHTKYIRKEIAVAQYSDAIAKEVELVKQCTSKYILKYYEVTEKGNNLAVRISTKSDM